MPLEIRLRLRDFYAAGSEWVVEMPTSWTEIAGAAATVGRDVSWSVSGVPRDTLLAEVIWRVLMLRSSLQQGGAEGDRLVRTRAFETLDGSEKGAVSFFLGQAIAKHVAEKLFGCVVFAHVDASLRAAGLRLHGSRPDFVGLRSDGTTVLVEAKGRGQSSSQVLRTAKQQVQAMPHVGAVVGLRYASLCYFTPGGELRVTLLDPSDDSDERADPRPAIAAHYERLVRLAGPEVRDRRQANADELLLEVPLPSAGVEVRLPAGVADEAAALGRGELSVQQFTAGLLERRERVASEPRAVQAARPEAARALVEGRSEAAAELARVSEIATETRSLNLADGTEVTVDQRWSEEQMRAAPTERS